MTRTTVHKTARSAEKARAAWKKGTRSERIRYLAGLGIPPCLRSGYSQLSWGEMIEARWAGRHR